MLSVMLNRDRMYSVSVQANLTDSYINVELSPTDAYELLQALEVKRDVIEDMAKNFYDCRDCGETHPKRVRSRPYR